VKEQRHETAARMFKLKTSTWKKYPHAQVLSTHLRVPDIQQKRLLQYVWRTWWWGFKQYWLWWFFRRWVPWDRIRTRQKIKYHHMFVGRGESKWLLSSHHSDMHVL
jgi:hypothetical protein